MNKTLVLVRHAHRDTSNRELDNGLSDKGYEQAEKVRDYFVERFPKSSPLILSSQKTRCMQTVEPIAHKMKVPVKTSALLMEQAGDLPSETEKEFRTRIKKFCDSWMKSKEDLTIACSHGDWIPEALRYLVDTTTDLKKGGWAEIALIDGKPTLKYLIQKFV